MPNHPAPLPPATAGHRALVLYAHPFPHRSRVNRLLADAARSVPGVDVHDLYASYPDFYIDVTAEQARLAAADVVVWLHPIQWYSMPSLMKEWVDSVLTAGWAYGSGRQLEGKTLLLAATTGSALSAYQPDGVHGRPFDDYLPAYLQTAVLCHMQWAAPHLLHGAHQVPADALDAHVRAFKHRLAALITPHQQD